MRGNVDGVTCEYVNVRFNIISLFAVLHNKESSVTQLMGRSCDFDLTHVDECY